MYSNILDYVINIDEPTEDTKLKEFIGIIRGIEKLNNIKIYKSSQPIVLEDLKNHNIFVGVLENSFFIHVVKLFGYSFRTLQIFYSERKGCFITSNWKTSTVFDYCKLKELLEDEQEFIKFLNKYRLEEGLQL